ncbi:cytochrome c oxidase assembly protein [Microbacteriaceae bacterium VKM Ac-2854]|nr:cytochrome c oxidase assembly protein [Microbacteriaceae bacterium VKM Ac-2854]
MYARALRGNPWPHARTALFSLGLAAFILVQCGFLGVYSAELRWAFSTRIALLLFVVPGLLAAGRPIALAGAALRPPGRARLERMLGSTPVRITGNAIFATLFAAGVFLLLLTPLAAVLRSSALAQNAITVVVPLLGLALVLPMAEDSRRRSSLFLTAEFLLAFVELVLDAIPGILLRINDTLFDTAASVGPAWFPAPLVDQHLSGDLLWFIAEIADIPVLVLLFIRWRRSDARDARAIDELSDAELEALNAEHLRRH